MVGKKPSVLIVDDAQVICNILHKELSKRGYLCSTAFNGNDALAKLSAQDFDVVLLDIRLPGVSGMEVLSTIQLAHHNTATIMITAVNNVDTAVESMRLGASDYIVKPFNLDRLDATMRTVLETKKYLPERSNYQTPLYLNGEEEDKQAMEESFSKMNAIAHGVEVKYDLVTGYSYIVTQRAIEIARQLDIPGKEIQKWVDERERLNSERNRLITSSLNKLGQSPLAQSIIGMAVPYLYRPKPDEPQN